MKWETITGLLPKDWEASCEEYGAMTRKRQIETPEQLLQMNLYYAEEGGSYNMTSLMMQETAGIELGKTATAKRIRGSWRWLQHLAQGTCRNQRIVMERPAFLGDRAIVIDDASDVSLPGSNTNYYRLHYAFELFGFSCRYMLISDSKKGERFGNYPIKEGDIVIGDRCYGTISGMEYVRKAKADYIVRLRSSAFKLYKADTKENRKGNESEETIDLNVWLRTLEGTNPGSIMAYYKAEGEYQAIRIVAQRKDEAAKEKSNCRIRQIGRRKNRKVSDTAIECNEYIVVSTSITDYSDEQIMELYRARWQIELVFRRMKSLIGIGEIPVSRHDSAMAWFYGKLLLASLCEAWIRSRFSPGGKSQTESEETIYDSLPMEEDQYMDGIPISFTVDRASDGGGDDGT